MIKKDQIEAFLEGLRNGYSITDAANLACFDRDNYYLWQKKDKEKWKLCEKAISEFKQKHIDNITTASLSNWTASAWLLERKFPDEFGKRENVKIVDKLEEWIEAFDNIGKDKD